MEVNASFETRVAIYEKGLKGGGNPDGYDDDQWGDVKDYIKLRDSAPVFDPPQEDQLTLLDDFDALFAAIDAESDVEDVEDVEETEENRAFD